MMNTALLFASISAGLILTLLLGPQWGVALGLLVYIAGNNVLLTQELKTLKEEFQKHFNDLPDLVRDLVRQQLQSLGLERMPPSPPTLDEWPAAPGPADKNLTLPDLERHLSAIETKFETLVELLARRETAQLVSEPQMETPHPKAKPIHAAERKPQESTASGHEPSSVERTSELAAMSELLGQMTLLLAQQRQLASKNTDMPSASPATPPPSLVSSGSRPTMDQLRAELDKLARELQNELNRPAS